MNLAFEQYNENEYEPKKSVEIDIEEMRRGYEAMAEINLEEAKAGEGTLNDVPFGW